MVGTLTSVVYVWEMLKRRLELIKHESACHGKLQSTSVQSSKRGRMT